MADYQRPHVDTLVRRLREIPRRLIAVLGPRQTGKTTIIRQVLAAIGLPSTYISVDEPTGTTFRPHSTELEDVLVEDPNPRDAAWLTRRWEQARMRCDGDTQGRSHVLVFDEIRTIPRWSEAVKGLWDADRAAARPLHVLVLGSAPLLMQAGLSESLAGRFETIPVNHWSFPEMRDAFGFDLDAYLYYGGYPGAASLIGEPDRWRDYVLAGLVEPHIERDILAMTRVDKPALLKRLFYLGVDYSGQILAYSKMKGNLTDAGNETTLARYLDLLGQAGLIAGLQAYSTQPHRRRSSPKLNVLNTALMTAGSDYRFAEAREDRSFWGRVVESAVGAHLLNTRSRDIHIHYWRERSVEVDFVIRRGKRLAAVEVKSGGRAGRRRGIEAFEKRFPGSRTLLAGSEGVPLAKFLSTPAGRWLE